MISIRLSPTFRKSMLSLWMWISLGMWLCFALPRFVIWWHLLCLLFWLTVQKARVRTHRIETMVTFRSNLSMIFIYFHIMLCIHNKSKERKTIGLIPLWYRQSTHTNSLSLFRSRSMCVYEEIYLLYNLFTENKHFAVCSFRNGIFFSKCYHFLLSALLPSFPSFSLKFIVRINQRKKSILLYR